MVENPGSLDGAVTFILLSYARPQNIQRILDAMRASKYCDRIILSNNQPAIDIHEYVDTADDRLEIIQQTEEWPAEKRLFIARDCPGEYFVSIDDDVFLTPDQINRLAGALIADPGRPHGVNGQIMTIKKGQSPGILDIRVELEISNATREVTVINQVYAFSRNQVRRFFEILDALDVHDPRELGPGEDIVLGFSGTRPPMCHDLGPVALCPTWDQAGIAVWRRDDFMVRRRDLFCRVYSVATDRNVFAKPS